MEQTQTSLPKPSLMFCSGRHYLFAAFITCNILLERQVASMFYINHMKNVCPVFSLAIELCRIRTMRSNQTERSHKNGATAQHPGNTRKLSKVDATAMSMGRKEAEGWRSWYTQFKICSIVSELVKVISSCPSYINLSCSCALVSESRTKELSEVP